MPDIFLVIARRWRLMLLLTLAGTAAAWLGSALSPKLFLSVATALPANAVMNDKARIFNTNIEGLYSDLGGAGELDRIEGTAQLDTLYLAVASEHRLTAHYKIDTTKASALDQAALQLQKATAISRSAYGELKIKVWDRNREKAAALANALLQTLNVMHERLQTENNKRILQKLKEAYQEKSADVSGLEEYVGAIQAERGRHQTGSSRNEAGDSSVQANTGFAEVMLQQQESRRQLQDYLRLISEYELALKTTPKALLVVEPARPSLEPNRPKTLRNMLLAFFASLLFSFLLAVLVESRNRRT